MAKDPFSNLPAIDPADQVEDSAGVAPDHVDAATDVTAGAPPRTLLQSGQKWAIPAIGLALGIWLFLPDDQSPTRRTASAPVEVDTARQADETAAMMKDMREQAAKKPPIAVPVMPGSQPMAAASQATAGTPVPSQASAGVATTTPDGYTPPTARPPLPPGYGGVAGAPTPMPVGQVDEKAAERAAQAYAAAVARQEEIRASAIEVTKVKLLGQSSGGAVAQPGALADLQSDLADAAEKAAAVRSQEAMHERILASIAPKESARSKGSNDEFLASNAAAAANAPQLIRQMSPQAPVVVNEGHVIRAVLMTRVNSDLPGRILARVSADVYDSQQRHIVIPKGSQLIGAYSSQIIVGQERLLMAMNRLILPNGSWISLSGAGASDMAGTAGVRADVNNHFWKMFGSSLVLGASTLLLPREDTTVSTLQSAAGNATPGTAGSVFATALNDVLKTLLDRNKQISPTLGVPEGEEFIFMVAHDMAMVPYRP